MYSRSGNGFSRNISHHCPHCMKDHAVGQRCEIACAYCHSFHLSAELIQGVCPSMHAFAKSQRPKNKLTCKGCQGEGMLEKSIDITYLELESKWQKRVNLFKSDPENNEQQPPRRKVVRFQQKLQSFQCKECEGTGIITKVIYCCRYGCEKCHSQRCYINPLWLKYKTEDYAATCNGIFSCSQCRKRIQMGDTYFSLPCDHLYHNECFIQSCWECLECEYAEEEKERMEAIKRMEQKLELQVSDIDSNEQEASYIENLKEEILNLSFTARRRSQEQEIQPRPPVLLENKFSFRVDID